MNRANYLSPIRFRSFLNKLKYIDVRVIVALIMILVFLLRLSLSNIIREPDAPHQGLDVDRWWYTAVKIVEGGGYTYYDGTPTARRVPVPVFFYAAVYKLLGENRLVVLSMLWLLDMGTAWLIFLIAQHIFKIKEVGLLAMLAFAFYLPEIRHTTRTFSEPIATFLLASFVLSLLKARQRLTFPWFAAAGVLLGLIILTRPTMVLFSVVSLLIFVTWSTLRQSPRKLLLNAVVFTIAVTTIMMPWIIRNYLTFQAFIPTSTQGGYNLYIEHYRLAEPDYTNMTYSSWEYMDWRDMDPVSKAELKDAGVKFVEWNGHEFPDWNEHEFDEFYAEKAWAFIQQYPERYLHLSVLRLFRLWFNIGYGTPPSLESYMVMVAHVVLLSLVFVAYFFYGGVWQKEAELLIWLLIYTTVMHVPIHAQARYFMPVMPYVLILAAYATIRLVKLWQESNNNETKYSAQTL